ncbi:hypothetical protein B0O99DRAFT_618365 [Bisporella sp. PMI_857]|nr:hypothetical protein B0O99DRAFT_618365 [Bisporella sp. PMI_857]
MYLRAKRPWSNWLILILAPVHTTDWIIFSHSTIIHWYTPQLTTPFTVQCIQRYNIRRNIPPVDRFKSMPLFPSTHLRILCLCSILSRDTGFHFGFECWAGISELDHKLQSSV